MVKFTIIFSTESTDVKHDKTRVRNDTYLDNIESKWNEMKIWINLRAFILNTQHVCYELKKPQKVKILVSVDRLKL